ncbi:MAG: PQQ-binding-like beta-propeller repeat protein, partial [Actinomycetota bacterium]|nr:PQQ-binding-like beta-propeller repeat protein [Actinomycetota bacterium]
MHRAIFVALACAFVLLVVGAGASSASRAGTTLSIPFSAAYTAAQLDAYAGADWLSVQGDLKNDRYSTLTQITPANVGKLKPAWHIHLGNCTNGLVVTAPLAAAVTPTPGEQIGVPAQAPVCGGEEANAVVASGVMYLEDSQSSVYALDATNGNQLWKYTPAFAPGYNNGSGSRAPGVSLGQGLVFVSEPDGFVTALNQVNGAVIWKAVAGDWHKGVSLSDTPAYYNGEVIVGTSGGDGGGISSVIEAFNATTGQLMWAWNIIPNHNQPGGNTWPWSDKTGANFGGGAIWQNPSIDAKDGLVIIGTGNTVPWNSRGPGENLWTDAIVALNVNTGAFVWGYQTAHHDLWDSDLPNNT